MEIETLRSEILDLDLAPTDARAPLSLVAERVFRAESRIPALQSCFGGPARTMKKSATMHF